MPFKFDADGHIVLQEVNGQKLPVFVGSDGKENAFDADSTVATIGRLNGEAKGHRERAESAESKLKGFEGITDPAAALKAIETVKNLDEKNLIAAGDRDKAVSEAVKSVEEKYGPVVKENEAIKAQLNEHLIGGAFSSSSFIAKNMAAEGPAGVEIARALFGKSLKVEDGKVVGYDSNGNKLFSKTRHGELANADEAIEQLIESYPHKDHILKGSGANGGNAKTSQVKPGQKSVTRTSFNGMSPPEQAAFAHEGGVVTD